MSARSTPFTPAALPRNGYIRASALRTFVPIAPATLWRWVKAGTFPAPVKLGSNTTAWLASDVQKWIDAKAGF